ncbi:hypothetical protein [Burkholderia contaminans]|uniref:hypothetical protein n=1 Tax=Burkholderia contaminans TaxID=488447 RepID=UPI0015894A73|nr:hypothetical protein [Burkholderia contaminans]
MKIRKIAMALLASLIASSAFAVVVTPTNASNATLNATLNITGSCGFTQSTYASTTNGTAGQTMIPLSQTQLGYNCSPGYSPTLTGINQTLSITGNTIYLNLYSDASATRQIQVTPVALTANGTNQTVTIYQQFSGSSVLPVGNWTLNVPLTINY